jgi:gas vesicle protein
MAEAHAHRPNLVLLSLVSGIAGAGIALLLAPRSGQETRSKLKSSAREMKEQAEDDISHLRSAATDRARKAREATERAASVIKTRKNQAVEKMHDKRDELDETIDNTKQSPALSAWEKEE